MDRTAYQLRATELDLADLKNDKAASDESRALLEAKIVGLEAEKADYQE